MNQHHAQREETYLTGLLSRMSIRRKLLLNCVLGLLVSSLCIAGVLISMNYQASLDETLRLSHASLDIVATSISQQLYTQQNTLESIKGYSPLGAYLKANYANEYANYVYYMDRVYPGLKLISDSSGEMRIRVYTNGEYTSFSGLTGGSLRELDDADWYDAQNGQPSGGGWGLTYMRINQKTQKVLCAYATLLDENHASHHVVAVFLGENTLRRHLGTPDEGIMLVLDGQGRVITANEPGLVALDKELLAERYGLIIQGQETDMLCSFEGDNYLMMNKPLALDELGLDNWQLIHLAPYTQITQDVMAMLYRSIAITVAILGASLILTLWVAGHMTSRLRILLEKIAAVTGGNLHRGMPVTGTDEFARINLYFDDMVFHIRALIDDNEQIHQRLMAKTQHEHELVVRQREAELSALRAQINPHFLFNTLETIRMNLLMKADRETANVMAVFAECIREYLSPTGTFMVLEDEMRFIDKYIFIQKYRFGERVHFHKNVPESLNAQLIPHLLIQPLIENAIQHGIERKSGEGHVTLSARTERGCLIFTVIDDGAGMDAAALEKLMLHIQAAEGESMGTTQLGLRNVHRRICLLYGEEYGLRIESVPGVGTVVNMILPESEV